MGKTKFNWDIAKDDIMQMVKENKSRTKILDMLSDKYNMLPGLATLNKVIKKWKEE